MEDAVGTVVAAVMEKKSTIARKEVEEECGVVGAPATDEESKKNGTHDTKNNNNNKSDALLWEQERLIRQQVLESRISGNLLGCFFANTYAAMHIFVVYLISLESLLSITLSVIMTVCEWPHKEEQDRKCNKHTLTPSSIVLKKFRDLPSNQR